MSETMNETMTQLLTQTAASRAMDSAALIGKTVMVPGSAVTVDGGVAADMAIHMMLLGTIPAGFEVIDHDGGLPALPEFQVAMYLTAGPRRAHAERLPLGAY